MIYYFEIKWVFPSRFVTKRNFILKLSAIIKQTKFQDFFLRWKSELIVDEAHIILPVKYYVGKGSVDTETHFHYRVARILRFLIFVYLTYLFWY